MTNKEKMTRHLRQAEALNQDVDTIELKALEELGLPGVTNQIQAYQMKNHLLHNALYHQRAGARNYNIQMALMYGIAAMLDEVDERP